MEKINVKELLKNCPRGMELDCTMFDNVTLEYVSESSLYPIKICREDGNRVELTKYGQYINADFAKCVIFPKGKTTWEGFQRPFKDGDILVGKANQPFIFKSFNRNNGCFSYCGIDSYELFHLHSDDWTFANSLRFATKEEEEKLLKVIKKNGYKWHADTRILEKLVVPEFKVGDRITNGKASITIGYIDDEYYYEVGRNIATRLFIKNQDEWNLVPNKFDIRTLKPFESKVLVRDDGYSLWQPCVWGLYDKGHRFPYVTTGCRYRQCIPYKGNEYLLGKTESCKDFYKTWE